MKKISKVQFDKMTKNKNRAELKALITGAVNETLDEGLMSNTQLLKLIKLKNEAR